MLAIVNGQLRNSGPYEKIRCNDCGRILIRSGGGWMLTVSRAVAVHASGRLALVCAECGSCWIADGNSIRRAV